VSADLVVGADGKNSAVAKAVRAPVLTSVPQQTIAAYAYWRGKPTTQAEVHHLPGRAVAVFPTDDNLTVTFVAAPADELVRVRRDALHFVRSTLARCVGTGEALQTDQLAERVRLAPELPHRMLQAHGPGWALVGDAGMVMDPVSAQGMTNAFLSAEMLARAVAQALEAGRPIDSSLDLYQSERDQRFAGMFAFTAGLARLAPSWQSALVVRRLGRSQQAIDRLLAVFSGLEPPDTFFGVRNLARLLGPGVRPTTARDAPRT
jgi:2-polyprenyl-6-methoxyphenol hydroxylase-like FAD-dependent oxidoreductase